MVRTAYTLGYTEAMCTPSLMFHSSPSNVKSVLENMDVSTFDVICAPRYTERARWKSACNNNEKRE